MRYDKRVLFYSVADEVYDPNTGELTEEEAFLGERLCAAYDLSMEDRLTLLGNLGIRGLMIHHRGPTIHADRLTYKGKHYWVKAIRQLRNKSTYLVEEAQR